MLDHYPAKPSLIVGDSEGNAVAVIEIVWPLGLVDALAAFTLSDSARVELVAPALIRPSQGPGAVCPCGGDPTCAGCGGDGVYRGTQNAVIVYELTPEGPGRCLALGDEPHELTVVSGFVARAFGLALTKRKQAKPMPLDLILEAVEIMSPHTKIRRLGEAGH